jgi:hypothetical protein
VVKRPAHAIIRLVLVPATVAIALTAGTAEAASLPAPKSLLLHSGEMPGFSLLQPFSAQGATRYAAVAGATGATARYLIASLDADGFVAGAYEELSGEAAYAGAQGLVTVYEFKSKLGAERDTAKGLSHSEKTLPKGNPTPKPLRVDLPDAHAYSLNGSYGSSVNVYFSVGRCSVFIGDTVPGATVPRAETPVLTGARAVDRRAAEVC